MNVGGLDLSTKRIGFAATDGSLHSLKAHAGADDPYRRLSELAREVEYALKLRPPWPDLLVVEDYAYGPYALAAVRLGEIGGVIRLRLFELDVRFVLVAPTALKRFSTGKGTAKKEQMVARAVALGARADVNDDEADAFHLRRMGRAAHGLEGNLSDDETSALAGVSW